MNAHLVRQRIIALRGYLFVGIAAFFWGTTGIFFKTLAINYHLGSFTIAFLRATLVSLYGLVLLSVLTPSSLRLRREDIPFLMLLGLVGVAMFHSLVISATLLTTVAMAWVLHYTAPAIVTLISWWFLGERLTRSKALVLVMTFVGCLLVVRAYEPEQIRPNALGMACGLGAGVCYALYTLFSKRALDRYAPLAVVTYSFSFGALFLAPTQFSTWAEIGSYPLSAWVLILVLATVTLLGYFSYAQGMQYLPASVASIVATLEPGVATVLAFFILAETLTAMQWIGGALIVGGVILLQRGESARVRDQESREDYGA